MRKLLPFVLVLAISALSTLSLAVVYIDSTSEPHPDRVIYINTG